MALNYELSGIANWKQVTTDPKNPNQRSPATHQLIWATMFLGFGEITEKNYKQFFARMFMWEKMFGNLRYEMEGEKVTPIYFTLKEIKDHIGLWTNATTRTDAAFNKAFMMRCAEEVRNEIARQENKDGN